MTKHISILDILKQSGKFNLVNLINNTLSIPKSIIIALVLAPRDYGIINFLGLWTMYAGLANPGFLSARSREMAHFFGAGEKERAVRIQNIAHTSDIIYSLVPFIVILSAYFFFPADRILKIGFLLTALTYAFSHFVNYWRGVSFVRQNFSLIAKADLITSVSTVLVIIVVIFWIKIYAVLIAPIVGAFLAGIYYWRKKAISYRFIFDWLETKRLFKIGISMSMLALVYWGFRLIDRTIIASFFSMDELGIYSYAAVFIFMGISFLSDFGNVFEPILWTKAGQSENRANVFYDTKRIIIYLSIVTAIMIPFSQVCFYLLVQLLTKKFITSIPVFIVLSCSLYTTTLIMIPISILESSAVNKQGLSLKTYVFGLALNIIFDLVVVHMGYGILGIALVTVIMQGLLTFAHFYLVRNYIFYKNNESPVFIFSVGIPFLLSVGFCLFHSYLIHRIVNPWLFGIISLPLQAVSWVVVILLFYRDYFSKDKVNRLIKELMDFISRFCAGFSKKPKYA